MDEYTLSVEASFSPEDARTVDRGLDLYNFSQVGDAHFQLLGVFLRDEKGTIVGGLLGETFWEWLYIKTLWVDEPLRRKGYGVKLVEAAEAEALKRGCLSAYLDTFSFQARPFYEELGYETLGILEDFPTGHERIFLKKKLSPAS